MAIVSYNTIHTLDPTIFDDFVVPTQINKNDLIENILLETMELETLYPDPAVIATAVGIWSKNRLHSWQRIADALYNDYSPFVNFTRDELRTTTYTPNLTNTDNEQYTPNLTDTNTGSGKGYNDAAFVEREKVVQQKTGGASTQTTHTETGKAETVETFHSQGDSAMYTPTDVAEKETNLRIKDDIINIITREFINRFCIMVY
jgi:hypothetical protein